MAVITRVYETYAEASRARDAVAALGIGQIESSVLGNQDVAEFRDTKVVHTDDASGAATGAGVGAALGGGAGLLAGLGMLAIPGLGPLVAAGWLAATAAGAAGGALAGGAIGALADLGIAAEDEPVFGEAIRRGHVAVSVRFPEEARASVERALDSVDHRAFTDLRDEYVGTGWNAEETAAQREARLQAEARDRTPLL